MLLRKNKPVYVYEAGKPIEQQPTHVGVISKQELIAFMRERNFIFSPKDIKKGTVQLSPHALQALNQSGLRSVHEPMQVMTGEQLRTYSRERAKAQKTASAPEFSSSSVEKTAQGGFVTRFLERKRQEERIEYSSRVQPPDLGFDLLGTVFSDRIHETRRHAVVRATQKSLGRVTVACAALTLAGSAYAVAHDGLEAVTSLYDTIYSQVAESAP